MTAATVDWIKIAPGVFQSQKNMSWVIPTMGMVVQRRNYRFSGVLVFVPNDRILFIIVVAMVNINLSLPQNHIVQFAASRSDNRFGRNQINTGESWLVHCRYDVFASLTSHLFKRFGVFSFFESVHFYPFGKMSLKLRCSDDQLCFLYLWNSRKTGSAFSPNLYPSLSRLQGQGLL